MHTLRARVLFVLRGRFACVHALPGPVHDSNIAGKTVGRTVRIWSDSEYAVPQVDPICYWTLFATQIIRYE